MGDSHDSSQFNPDAPLRLSIAAKLAFPDGSMTVSGLRREAARGRLRLERIAGKDFTTLADIKRMRELCRVQTKALDFSNGSQDIVVENSSPKLSGSSKTVAN